MKTAIVSDSNCGISKSEADNMGIFILPMPVCIGDSFYYEGIDLDRNRFFNHLANHEKIHTSQPSPGNLLDMWKNVFDEGYDELVYIPMSSGLSSSFDTARLMAKEFPGKVYVADAHRISVTQRHAIMDALYLLKCGFDAAAIKEELEKNALNSIVFVGVDDIEYLKQGGRITPTAAAMTSVLGIKPLLVIGGNKIDAYEKVRGRKHCEKKLLEAMKERADCFKNQGYDVRIGIAGSFPAETDSLDWYRKAEEVFPDDELIYDPLTCSVSGHVGPNAFGMGVSVKITL